MDASKEPSLKHLGPVAYPYSATEKLSLFFPCIRQRLAPKQNLFAGPFAGEFGLELMQWQAFVRGRRSRYENVHVLTYPGREYLYEGCQVHSHNIDLKTAGYGYGLLSPDSARQMGEQKADEIGLTNYDIFDTSLLCTRYHKGIWKQEFRIFNEAPLVSPPYDVVFHFRAVEKKGPDLNKNYPLDLADELVRLCTDRGLSVACVGHPDYSYCPNACPDHRSVNLRETVAAVSSARAVAGENSGPMHLANLCAKPTIIWAHDQWRTDYSLRWNPFRVPIYVVTNESFQPPAPLVCESIVNALSDLRLRSNDFTTQLHTFPAQPIAPY